MTIPDFYSHVNGESKPEETPDFYSLFENEPSEPPIQAAPEQPSENQPQTTQQPYEKSFFDKWFIEPHLKQAELDVAQAETAKKAIPQIVGGSLEGLTLGAVDIMPPESQEEEIVREMGRWYGLGGPIKLLNKALKPLYTLARSSKTAPRSLYALSRITGAAATGATVKTAETYFKEGELPSAEEIAKEGAIWAAVDVALQSAGVLTEFGLAVNSIAKKEGVPAKEVFKKLWNATKNYAKQKFGRDIKKPEDIKPEDIQKLITEAETADKKVATPESEPKPKEKPNRPPVTEFESLSPEQQEEYATLVTDLTKVSHEKELKYMSDEAKMGRAKIYDQLAALSYLNEYDRTRFAKHAEEHRKEVSKHEEKEPKKPEEKPAEEPSKPVETPKESSKSGYERKPTPVTYEEKVKHLVGKIQESQTYADDLKDSIAVRKGQLKQAKEELNKLAKNQKDVKWEEAGKKVDRIESDLEAKQQGLDSEQNYIRRLKDDLKDLKTNKEKSTVKVPLGARSKPVGKKFNKRPKEEKLQRKKPIIGKKQAKKRSDILKNLRKAFFDPVRIGKRKMSLKKAAGEHDLWARISRLVKDNDIEIAAHEIGHNLHTYLYGGDAKGPIEQRNNISKALRPYLDELKPLALYEPFGMEGFAEFTRLYVTNPETALELAPKFYAKFEADLDAFEPEMKNALLQAREYYQDYLEGTPESRIRAQTSYAEDQGKLAGFMEWIKSLGDLDKLKTDWLDDVFPAKRLVAEAFGIPLTEVENLKDPRNLYRSLRVLKGSIGKADVFLLFETFDSNTLKRKGRGLASILKKIKSAEEYKEFNDYLIAARAIEKSLQNIDTGISLGDAIEVESKLRPKYKRLAALLNQYNDAMLTYARDSGMLSDKQYSEIKKANMMYVPFQRVMEKPQKGSVGGSKLQASKTIKRMKGSERDIIAPIESIIKNTYAIIINAEKNRSGQVLAKLAAMKNMGAYVHRVPTPIALKGKISGSDVEEKIANNLFKMGYTDFLEAKIVDGKATFVLKPELSSAIPELFLRFGPTTYPAGENIITVFEEGKATYYEVSPEIFEMWNKGIQPYTADLLIKILRTPASWLRAGAILNPKFMMKNFVRDTWGGFLFSKFGKDIKNPVDFFIDAIYQPLAQLSVAAKQGKLYVEWMKAGGGMSTMQSFDRASVVKKLEEIRSGIKPTDIMGWLRKVAAISEEGNRLAEFGRALAVEGDTRLGKEMAAFAARDLSIDFAKMGLRVKALNQIIPFFNATIQGTDKLIRSAMSDKDRAEFFARVAGFVVIPSLIFAWLNMDDERVEEMQDQERDFNFITFIGDTALKIPVPFETGVIAHGLTQRLFNFFIKKDPEAFEGFMGSVMSAMMPNFIPSLANPLIEAEANRNFFTGARIVPASKERLIAKYQYKNNTSATARLIGRAMAYMLGQETRSKAASPAVIDHFINSWGGGLGRLIVEISDAALKAVGLDDRVDGPERSVTERLGLDAFVARYPRSNTKSIEQFYDYYQDATARQQSFKYAQKMELETAESQQEAYKRFDDMYDYNQLKAAYKAMQNSQKAINNIWNDPDIEPKLKKEMIDDLYHQQIEFARSVVQSVKERRSGK